jgi:P27 family predicted phage terminase small subunit
MASMGRPPKPSKLRILEGNRSRTPINDREPQPTSGVESRPEWLCPEAKREWVRLVGELSALGLLSKVDRGTLAAYCQCWGMYVGAVKDIEANGISVVTESGYPVPRSEVALMVKMLDKMATFGGKLGLSPSDRVRLAVPEKPHDDLEQMMRGESVQ